MSQSASHEGATIALAPGVGPRTGSDPNNSAQEVAVLRAELRGLEGVLKERALALDKALGMQAESLERRMFDRAGALDKALDTAKAAHDQRLEDRATTLEKSLALRTEDDERRLYDRWANHHREHAAIDMAVTKAEQSVDKRLEAMNEMRAQIDRERGTYVTRELHDASTRDKLAQIHQNSDKLIVLTAELSGLREDLGAMKSGQEWLGRLVAGTVVTAVVGLLFALFRGGAL